MNRIGTVIVFKDGVTREEAAAALEKIRAVLDVPEVTMKYEHTGARGINGGRVVRPVEQRFTMADKIHEFDDEHGGPVWYIP